MNRVLDKGSDSARGMDNLLGYPAHLEVLGIAVYRLARIRGRILTMYTSDDVFSRKEVPFAIFGAWIGIFKPNA